MKEQFENLYTLFLSAVCSFFLTYSLYIGYVGFLDELVRQNCPFEVARWNGLHRSFMV